MKYLIMEDFSGQPIPFVFPRRVDHADMRDQLPYTKAVSCGYMDIADGDIRCYGGCAELELKARPEEDAAILRAAVRNREDS